jgi:hypothetical protein
MTGIQALMIRIVTEYLLAWAPIAWKERFNDEP